MNDSYDPTMVVVLTTMPDRDAAEALSSRLVEERSIACANIVRGVTSIYRWDDEVLVVMKTTAGHVAALQSRVEALHPYDVPEILVLPVAGGHAPYLEWVASEVSG
jgi:periplasmic divalent cation tolerance protein